MTCKTLDELHPWYPRTEEAWRLHMTPKITLDGTDILIYDLGTEHSLDVSRTWYIPFGKTHESDRIYLDPDCDFGFTVPIDPRYQHDQNRAVECYREAYRGAPENWAREGDTPTKIYAPYESVWRARIEDEQRRGVKYDYQYQWLTDPR